MELLFLIFKIILIVLLVVVGLVVFLLGFVLLVPIRYEISGDIKDSKEISLKGKITYCLSALKLIVSYQNGQTNMWVYLFGFQKKAKQEKESEIDSQTEKQDAVFEADTEETASQEMENSQLNDIQTDSESSHSEQTDLERTVGQEDVFRQDESVEKEQSVAQEGTEQQQELLSDEGFFPEEDAWDEQTQEESGKRRIKKEKKESRFDFAFIKQQLTDEHNHSAVKKIFSEFGYLLKHFKFRKIQTDLTFSAGDPALTGQSLGVLCMFPFLYRYEFHIIPDFEAETAYIKGSFLAAGQIRLVHILIITLRLILNKDVRLAAKNVLSMLK